MKKGKKEEKEEKKKKAGSPRWHQPTHRFPSSRGKLSSHFLSQPFESPSDCIFPVFGSVTGFRFELSESFARSLGKALLKNQEFPQGIDQELRRRVKDMIRESAGVNKGRVVPWFVSVTARIGASGLTVALFCKRIFPAARPMKVFPVPGGP